MKTDAMTLARISSRYPSRRGGASHVAIGCIAVVIVLALLLAGAATWVLSNWKGWASDAMMTATQTLISEAGFPQAEQTEIIEQVERVASAFRDGTIELEQFGSVLESIGDGPFITLGVIQYFQINYIDASSLPDDETNNEKAAARHAFERLARGIADGVIEPSAYDGAIDPIRAEVVLADGTVEYSEKNPVDVTVDELRECAAIATSLADEGGVAQDVEPVDLSEQLRADIDAVLGDG